MIKGQQAAEFVILTGVLFLICLGSLYLFGDKIAYFFNNNSLMKNANTITKYTPISENNETSISSDQAIIKSNDDSDFITVQIGEYTLNDAPVALI